MIILDNYSKKQTCIVVNGSDYTICAENDVKPMRDGEGGFSEDGELLGTYTLEGKFFFLYKNNHYEVYPKNIHCSNAYIDNEMRQFIIKINNKIVCDITYKPFVDPLFLSFDGEEDEFDYLMHLSKILKDEDSICNFIIGIQNLNDYYKESK